MTLLLLLSACAEEPVIDEEKGTTGTDPNTEETGDTGETEDTDQPDDSDTGRPDDTDTGRPDDSDTGRPDDSDTGRPDDSDTTVTEPNMLDGRQYSVDPASGDIVSPSGGDLLLSFVDLTFYLGVLDATDTTIDFVGTVPGDSCDTQFDTPTAALDASLGFSVGPTDVVFPIDSATMTFHDFTLDGNFNGDGSRIENVALSGQIDLDELAPALGYGSGSEVCALISAFGISCSSCDGGGSTCLDLAIEDIEGMEDASFTPNPC